MRQRWATFWVVCLCLTIPLLILTARADTILDPNVTLDTGTASGALSLTTLLSNGTAIDWSTFGSGAGETINILNDTGSTLTGLSITGVGIFPQSGSGTVVWHCFTQAFFTTCPDPANSSAGFQTVSFVWSGGGGVPNNNYFSLFFTGFGNQQFDWTITANTTPPAVPEPGTLAMLGSGLVAVGHFVRRKFLG